MAFSDTYSLPAPQPRIRVLDSWMKESCSLAERQLLRGGIRSRVLETRVAQNARATFSGCHSGLHSTSSGGSGAPPVVRARKSPKRRVENKLIPAIFAAQ